MSSTSRNFAAILLLLLVAVEFGGGSLLTPTALASLSWRTAIPYLVSAHVPCCGGSI